MAEQSRASDPLSLQQERLLLAEFLDPDCGRYNKQFILLSLEGTLDVGALRLALLDVATKHGALRLRISLGSEGYEASTFSPELFDVDVVDICALSADEAMRRVDSFTARDFELIDGRLCGATIFLRSTQLVWVLLSTHHIVFDNWSFWIFLRDLGNAYRGLVSQPAGDRKVASCASYAEYARWQRQQEDTEFIAGQKNFWRGTLRSEIPPSFLQIYEGGAGSPYRSARHLVRLTASETRGIRQFAQQQKVSLFTALLACYLFTLQSFGGRDEILMGIPVAGRTQAKFFETIGLFANFLMVPMRIGATVSGVAALQTIKAAIAGAVSHQEVQAQHFASLAPWTLCCQYIFQLQTVPATSSAVPGVTTKVLAYEYGPNCVDISLTLVDSKEHHDAQIGGYIDYNADLVRERGVMRFWARFQDVLGSLIDAPSATREELLTRTSFLYP